MWGPPLQLGEVRTDSKLPWVGGRGPSWLLAWGEGRVCPGAGRRGVLGGLPAPLGVLSAVQGAFAPGSSEMSVDFFVIFLYLVYNLCQLYIAIFSP